MLSEEEVVESGVTAGGKGIFRAPLAIKSTQYGDEWSQRMVETAARLPL